MGDLRTDPKFAMCRALVDGADLASFVEGPFDIRAVVAAIRPEKIGGVILDDVPWENFPHGEKARDAVRLLRAGDGSARFTMGVLIGMCANDSRASAALAVPFLIRIATDPHSPHRAEALRGLAAPTRARHFGIASRDELSLHRSGPQHRVLDDYDDYGAEVAGYPAGWSVAAARTAITMLLPLLDDSDVTTRVDASYALATTAEPNRKALRVPDRRACEQGGLPDTHHGVWVRAAVGAVLRMSEP
ncbi:hypothetical protein [Streptomyces sp. NPDC005494]|uniref:hypothetical protein n=1 Tax=Streptomyces sp. NPDC005494 TaxID=3364715 RepID=UPI0036BEDA19